MEIDQINSSNAAAVAKLMAAIKPDWWDFEGASQQLLEAEVHAREKGFRNLKYVISSPGLSCHDRPLANYADELRTLTSHGRAHFDYFVDYGFTPAGLIPNCYGNHCHGIIMIKPLV